jgi:hypothetical protein
VLAAIERLPRGLEESVCQVQPAGAAQLEVTLTMMIARMARPRSARDRDRKRKQVTSRANRRARRAAMRDRAARMRQGAEES